MFQPQRIQVDRRSLIVVRLRALIIVIEIGELQFTLSNFVPFHFHDIYESLPIF